MEEMVNENLPLVCSYPEYVSILVPYLKEDAQIWSYSKVRDQNDIHGG